MVHEVRVRVLILVLIVQQAGLTHTEKIAAYDVDEHWNSTSDQQNIGGQRVGLLTRVNFTLTDHLRHMTNIVHGAIDFATMSEIRSKAIVYYVFLDKYQGDVYRREHYYFSE